MSLSIGDIAWQLAFWLLFAITVLPFPLKIYGYLKGTDESPLAVKLDEVSAVILCWIGLVGFFGFLYGSTYMFPNFWYGWLVVMTLTTVTGPLWSPKLSYAKQVLGENVYRVTFWFSIAMYLPMMIAVYKYADAT